MKLVTVFQNVPLFFTSKGIWAEYSYVRRVLTVSVSVGAVFAALSRQLPSHTLRQLAGFSMTCDIAECEHTGELRLCCVWNPTWGCAFAGGRHHENERGQGARKRPEALWAWQPGRCIASRCLTVWNQCSQTEEKILVEKLQGKGYNFLLRITSWQKLRSLAFNGTLLAGWHLGVVCSCQGKKEMPCPLGSRVRSQATLIFTRTYSLDNICSI